jgi:hypothetical protein
MNPSTRPVSASVQTAAESALSGLALFETIDD